jgi:hypothetical protein
MIVRVGILVTCSLAVIRFRQLKNKKHHHHAIKGSFTSSFDAFRVLSIFAPVTSTIFIRLLLTSAQSVLISNRIDSPKRILDFIEGYTNE